MHFRDTTSYSTFLSEYSATTRSIQAPMRILEAEHFIGEPILAVNAAGQGVLVWKSFAGETPTGYWGRFTMTDTHSDANGDHHEP